MSSNVRRLPVDARLAGVDAARHARADRRRRALAAVLTAPGAASVENSIRGLAHVDGDGHAHTIGDRIA